MTPGQLPGPRPQPHWDYKQAWSTTPVVAKHLAMKDKLAKAGQIMA